MNIDSKALFAELKALKYAENNMDIFQTLKKLSKMADEKIAGELAHDRGVDQAIEIVKKYLK